MYVLSYRWGFNTCTVTMTKNGKKLQGVEDEDTCLAFKLRVQDQFGFPVCNIKLFQRTHKIEVREYWYIARGAKNGVIGLADEQKPFSKIKNTSHNSQLSEVPHLVAITVQELQIEGETDERKRGKPLKRRWQSSAGHTWRRQQQRLASL